MKNLENSLDLNYVKKNPWEQRFFPFTLKWKKHLGCSQHLGSSELYVDNSDMGKMFLSNG